MSVEPERVAGDGEDPERALLGSAPTQWGDRGRPAVQSVKSVQARLSRLLVGLLLGVLTAGLLVWYYARAWNKPIERRAHAQAVTQNKAKGEMSLPPLGSLESFRHALRTQRASGETSSAAAAESRLEVPAPTGMSAPGEQVGGRQAAAGRLEVPLQLAPVQPGTAAPRAGSRPGARRVSADERRLGGHVFSAAGCPAEATGCAGAEVVRDSTAGGGAAQALSGEMPSAGPLDAVPWWMPKGWVLECTLETAIDSTLPGLTTCVMPVDVFGADGQVVLLPRGTQLVGETRGTVHQGQARIAVLWSEARTPEGVVVRLASSGTDALGRAGLPGEVDRQFGERFGAAILLSVIDGAIAAGVASQQHSQSSVMISPNASQEVMTELLKDTAEIRPRLVKAQGDRIAVLVARDIDFRSVSTRTRANGASEIAGGEWDGSQR